jgi:hypothetical protein
MKVPTAVAKEERGFVADLLQCKTTDVVRRGFVLTVRRTSLPREARR